MLSRISRSWRIYPRQFWLMFWGMIISTIGSSMIWPFLMIYVSDKLKLPLTTVATLMSINAAASLISSFIAGPIIDRLGRKWVMVISLIVSALNNILLSSASTLPVFAVLMAISGAANPLYRVGADAMMADLLPSEQRPDGYSLLRMANNIGVAIGPAIGGFIAILSYSIAFYIAAAGLMIYALLIGFFAAETLPAKAVQSTAHSTRFGGYGHILRDSPFMLFTGAFTFTSISASIVWILLSVYTKHNFGIPENMYGWIPTTNAIMVVAFQYVVTQFTKKRKILHMMTIGALFYALGSGSIALGNNFWAFWLSMVILTIGELIISPTATTFVADLAPADMRGRYMSIYGLTWGVASGIGPVIGGVLNDNIGPLWIWVGAGLAGLVSVAGFLLLSRQAARKTQNA
jgi:MFS family permease